MQYDPDKNIKDKFKEHLYNSTAEYLVIRLLITIFILLYYYYYSVVVIEKTTPIYTRLIPLGLTLALLIFHFSTDNKFNKLKTILYSSIYFLLIISLYIESLLDLKDNAFSATVGALVLIYFIASLELTADYIKTAIIYFSPLIVFTIVLTFFYVVDIKQKGVLLTIYPVVIFGFLINRHQYTLRYKLFKTNYNLREEENKILKRTEETIIINKKIEEKSLEISNHHEKIKTQYKGIEKGLNYAKVIQQAMFPKLKTFKENFQDYFIFYLPRNVVSGDFYWAEKYNDTFVYATADSTGHGVPAALVSMLGISLLNKIINQDTGLKASEILDTLRYEVKKSLKQSDIQTDNTKEGMDISLCMINKKTLELQFSGANNSLYIARNGELIELKADRQPIAIWINETDFTNHEFQLQPNDILYSFSDGFQDQFNENGKKYRIRRFKEFLLKTSNSKNMTTQKFLLEQEYNSWKGNQMQIDDIVIAGIKI